MVSANADEIKEAIKRLFNSIGIKRIIFVDDIFRLGIEEVIGKIDASSDKEQYKTIDELKDISFSVDPDIWKESLRKRWESLEKEQQIRVRNLLIPDEDTKLNITFRSILPIEISLIPLSLDEWDKEKQGYIGQADILFLFDQDFHNESHGTEETGYTLIKEVSRACDARCALISHKYTTDEAYEKWGINAEKYDIKKSRFVLISKELLRETELFGFIHMLKLMVLNDYCGDLLSQITNVIKESYEGAIEKITNLDIYNFDHAVFRTSYEEGTWEPDTLLRLFGIYQKEIVRNKSKNNANIHQLATKIRGISCINTKLSSLTIGNSLQLQRGEMYETADHLNKIHLPIELGDIFQKENGKNYILLGQPCDLMMRSEGYRYYDIFESIVAEIVPNNSSKTYYYELKYFENTGKSAFVNFKQIFTINLCVLDLCVYQDNGEAIYISGKPCPEIVIPSWKVYYHEIIRHYEKAITRYYEFQKNGQKRDVLYLIIPKSSRENLFKSIVKIDKKEKTISYDCKRVGRLCQPYSGAMLTEFANYIARAAFEHDWTKPDYN